MTALVLALIAALGVHLLVTPRSTRASLAAPRARRPRLGDLDLGGARPAQLAATSGALFVLGSLVAFGLFGGPLPAVVTGAFAATFPVTSARLRRRAAREAALDAWPRLLEEIRVLTATLGRSVPQAVGEVGRRAPSELRPAFEAAHREWLLSTDFERTVAVLKRELDDAAADAACETLLVAHEVGGADLPRRLEALVEDRVQEAQGRKDARAKQAGARFARRFVLVVPLGMALAGMSVGTGRAAYQTPVGQVLVVVAIATVVLCWVWAGRILALPPTRRVFDA